MKKPFVEGSGNVFADLGFANPEEALAKSNLVSQIAGIIEKRKLTQVQAAKVLGVDQPKVSALMRGRLTDFSMERLFRFLGKLGQDVEISIAPSKRKPPKLVVYAEQKFRMVVDGRR